MVFVVVFFDVVIVVNERFMVICDKVSVICRCYGFWFFSVCLVFGGSLVFWLF